jgi:hypothetical protein
VGVDDERIDLKIQNFQSYLVLWECLVLNPTTLSNDGGLLKQLNVPYKHFMSINKTAGLWPALLQGIRQDGRFKGSVETRLQKVTSALSLWATCTALPPAAARIHMQAVMKTTWLGELSTWIDARRGYTVSGQSGSWRAKAHHPLRVLQVGNRVWQIVYQNINDAANTSGDDLRALIEDSVLVVVSPGSTFLQHYKVKMDAAKAVWKPAEPDRLPPTKRSDQGVLYSTSVGIRV